MKAMIFAAGLGTRLKPFTDSHPKALAQVGSKTLLELNIHYLKRFGINDIIVNVHHFAEMIEKVVTQNNGFGTNIAFSDERAQVLETGGGLKKASWFFAGEPFFVVMNVDILSNLDLRKMITAHTHSGSVATLAVMKRASSRQLLFNNGMQLCGWKNKNTGEEKISKAESPLHEFAFSGIQIVSNSIWHDAPFEGKFPIVDLYLHATKNQLIKGFDHTGDLLIDVGKPESIEKATLMFPES